MTTADLLPKCMALLFLVAVFGQSGLDKVLDYRGNQTYFQEQFKKSPLNPLIGALLPLITLMEVATTLLALLGLVTLVASGQSQWGLYACALGCLTLIALVFGQRVAKDYGGAAGIVPYLAVALLGLFFFS